MGNIDDIVNEMGRRLGYEGKEEPIISEAQAKIYYVQPGDIMGNKAQEWGVPLNQIQILNPDMDLGKIKPGQAIKLPPFANIGEQPPKEVSIMLANPQQTLVVNSKIHELASKYGVPKELIYGHVYRESGYYKGAQAIKMGYFETPPATREEAKQPTGMGYIVNAGRTSSAGAQGLYQVMPQNVPKGANIWDPAQSLEIGVDWFVNKSGMPEAKKLLGKYLGKKAPEKEELLEMALYIYNAGQGIVERALRAKGANFREALPSETRQYAPAILSWMKQGINYLVVASPMKVMVK